MEFEEAKYAYAQAGATFKSFHQTQLTTWANELRKYEEEVERLTSEIDQIVEESEDFTLLSPVSGTIQGSQGLTIGSQVFTGVDLFNISPNKELIVESYISPKDIVNLF